CLNHFARSAGVLAFGVTVEISPVERGQMKQPRERDQRNKERVTERRRIQRRRINQRILNTESAGAGGHRANRQAELARARYFSQSAGNGNNLAAGISIRAIVCRHSAINASSAGRVIRKAHQNRARCNRSSQPSITNLSPNFAAQRESISVRTTPRHSCVSAISASGSPSFSASSVRAISMKRRYAILETT